MNDKNYAFVDRKCERCKGTGEIGKVEDEGKLYNIPCPECRGWGKIGSFEEVPNIPINGDKEFGNLLRKTREDRQISMSELAILLKCKVSRISEIETGIVMPTDKERKLLQEWIDGE